MKLSVDYQLERGSVPLTIVADHRLSERDSGVVKDGGDICYDSGDPRVRRDDDDGGASDLDRKSTRLNSSHTDSSRMPSSA